MIVHGRATTTFYEVPLVVCSYSSIIPGRRETTWKNFLVLACDTMAISDED